MHGALRFNVSSLRGSLQPDKSEIKSFQSSTNSYLGIMKHYKTFNIRKKMLYNILSERLKKLFRTNIKLEKVIIKK